MERDVRCFAPYTESQPLFAGVSFTADAARSLPVLPWFLLGLLPLVALVTYPVPSGGSPTGDPSARMAFINLGALFSFAALATATLFAARVLHRATAQSRRDGVLRRQHLAAGARAVRADAQRVLGLLGPAEMARVAVIETEGRSSRRGLTAALLGLLTALLYFSAEVAMPAAGEWAHLTLARGALLVAVLGTLLQPDLRAGLRAWVLAAGGAALAVFFVRPPVTALDWLFFLAVGVLVAANAPAALRDHRDGQRRRYLLVTVARVVLVEPGPTGAYALAEVEGELQPQLVHAVDGFRLDLPLKDGSRARFSVRTQDDLRRLSHDGPPSWRSLADGVDEPHALAEEWLRLPLAAALFSTAALFYAFVGYGVVLSNLLVPEMGSWAVGRTDHLLANMRVAAAWYPLGASVQTYLVSAAADAEAWDEALAAFERAGAASRGLGQAGRMLSADPRFRDLLVALGRLDAEVAALQPPAGAPGDPWRAVQRARRQAELYTVHPSLLVRAPWRQAVARLRAAESAAPAWPEARLELARALVGVPPYLGVQRVQEFDPGEVLAAAEEARSLCTDLERAGGPSADLAEIRESAARAVRRAAGTPDISVPLGAFQAHGSPPSAPAPVTTAP